MLVVGVRKELSQQVGECGRSEYSYWCWDCEIDYRLVGGTGIASCIRFSVVADWGYKCFVVEERTVVNTVVTSVGIN